MTVRDSGCRDGSPQSPPQQLSSMGAAILSASSAQRPAAALAWRRPSAPGRAAGRGKGAEAVRGRRGGWWSAGALRPCPAAPKLPEDVSLPGESHPWKIRCWNCRVAKPQLVRWREVTAFHRNEDVGFSLNVRKSRQQFGFKNKEPWPYCTSLDQVTITTCSLYFFYCGHLKIRSLCFTSSFAQTCHSTIYC